MLRASVCIIFAASLPVMAGGCTLWPPELPGRSAVSGSPASDGSGSTAPDASASESQQAPREDPLYIE